MEEVGPPETGPPDSDSEDVSLVPSDTSTPIKPPEKPQKPAPPRRADRVPETPPRAPETPPRAPETLPRAPEIEVLDLLDMKRMSRTHYTRFGLSASFLSARFAFALNYRSTA